MIVMTIAMTASLNASSLPRVMAAVCLRASIGRWPTLEGFQGSASKTSKIRIHTWKPGGDVAVSEDVGGLRADRQGAGQPDLDRPRRPRSGARRRDGRALGLHPLIAEDIVESNERAKVQLVGEVIHVVGVRARARGKGEVETHEIDFVLGAGFLLSAHPDHWDPMTAHQLRMGVAPLLERGADFVLWALVDSIVDGYFPVFDRMGDEIDDVQTPRSSGHA
jgi:hypothetical protein